jgi:serine/threonine-protein kinase
MAGNTTRSWNDASCAITDGGQLYCWGAVEKLVNASDSPYAVPVLADGVAPMTGVVQADISSSGSFCALVQGDSERAAYCWGGNGSGQLGQGHETSSEYPILVPGLDDPSKVIIFGWGVTACAIEGTAVRCWGQNGAGATGTDNSDANVLTPAPTVLPDGATRLEGVVDIVGGSTDLNQGLPGSACALLEDKTVKCWGAGYSTHPENLGVPNVWRLGVIDEKKVRLLTTDGKYHVDGIARDVSCNPI